MSWSTLTKKNGSGRQSSIYVAMLLALSGAFSLVMGAGGYLTNQTHDNTPIYLALSGLYSVIGGYITIQVQSLRERYQSQDLRVSFVTEISDQFEEYCKTNIEPLNKIWDQNRKSYIKAAVARLICFVILFIIWICLEAVIFPQYLTKGVLSNFIVALSPLLFLAVFYWAWTPVLNFNGIIKSQVYPVLFGFWQKHCIYTFKSTFNASKLQDFVIIPPFRLQTTQDEIKGVHDGIDFFVVNSDLYTPEIKYAFHGLFVMFKINKKFSGKTVVTLQYKEQIQELLPSIQLGQGFQVYTTDPEQERSLFGSDFADKLINIQALFNANSIEASFYDQKLLLKIETDLVFCKPNSILESCNFIEDANEIYKKMQLVFNTIDLLGLELH